VSYLISILVLILLVQQSLVAAETEKTTNLSKRTDNIQAQAIELNRDLFLLEEDLLHPASTRLALYVSMDFGRFFALEAVKLKLDGEPITSFLYTIKDVEALKRGAIHPLYLGNIASGPHELVAFFTGLGPHGRAYKRAVTMKFDKKSGEKALEIQIIDDTASQQPQFKIKVWN